MEDNNKFLDDSLTEATVVSGLGYPMGRDEQTDEPTGWFGLSDADDIVNVSRETLDFK